MKLYNEDCIAHMRFMKDESVDLCVTDIPYGQVNRSTNGLRNLDKQNADIVTFPLSLFVSEVSRITKGSIYIFCGTEQVSDIRKNLVRKGFSTRLIIWEKTNPSPMNGASIWLSGVECCVYGKKPKAVFNEHCKNTVLRYPCSRNKLHPTQKPLALITKLIEVSSNPLDVVFDPCMGSGTTGVACVNTNRNFIGIELDEQYFNIAKQRISNAESDRIDLLSEDGA